MSRGAIADGSLLRNAWSIKCRVTYLPAAVFHAAPAIFPRYPGIDPCYPISLARPELRL